MVNISLIINIWISLFLPKIIIIFYINIKHAKSWLINLYLYPNPLYICVNYFRQTYPFLKRSHWFLILLLLFLVSRYQRMRGRLKRCCRLGSAGTKSILVNCRPVTRIMNELRYVILRLILYITIIIIFLCLNSWLLMNGV